MRQRKERRGKGGKRWGKSGRGGTKEGRGGAKVGEAGQRWERRGKGGRGGAKVGVVGQRWERWGKALWSRNGQYLDIDFEKSLFMFGFSCKESFKIFRY